MESDKKGERIGEGERMEEEGLPQHSSSNTKVQHDDTENIPAELVVSNYNPQTERILHEDEKQVEQLNSQISESLPVDMHRRQPQLKPATFNLHQELLETRRKYQQLLEAPDVQPSDKDMLKGMLANIDMQLRNLKHDKPTIETNRNIDISPTEKVFSVESALQFVFDYYCKQSYATGKNATFDRIKHESNILTMNKYMMFCRDFDLIGGNAEKDTKLLKMNELVEIFKKNSENYKEMHFEGFKKGLMRMSQLMFEGTESLSRLYDYVEISNEGLFRQKTKKLHLPFFSKQNKTGSAGSKPSYRIHMTKRTPISGSRADILSLEKQQLNVNVSAKQLPQIKLLKPILPRPPALPPKPSIKEETPLYIPLPANRISIKAIRQQPLVQHNLSNHRLNTSNSQQTGYSQIHGNKKRGFTIASTPDDKRQFRLNNIVAEARQVMGDRATYMERKTEGLKRKQANINSRPNLSNADRESQENRASLAGLIDDTEDEYLSKHWQMESGRNKEQRHATTSLHQNI